MHALEKEMATHSSILAWRIPGIEEPGGLPSVGSHRVRHNWSNLAAAAEKALYWRIISQRHFLEMFSMELFCPCSEEASCQSDGVDGNLSIYLTDFSCVQVHVSFDPPCDLDPPRSTPVSELKLFAISFLQALHIHLPLFCSSSTSHPLPFQLPQILANFFFTFIISPFPFWLCWHVLLNSPAIISLNIIGKKNTCSSSTVFNSNPYCSSLCFDICSVFAAYFLHIICVLSSYAPCFTSLWFFKFRSLRSTCLEAQSYFIPRKILGLRHRYIILFFTLDIWRDFHPGSLINVLKIT